MEYRELESTGLKVSVIGMGCEGFSEDNYGMAKRMFDRAEELGINYFDLYASDPELRAAVGNAISGRRDKFIIQSHIGSICKNGQYEMCQRRGVGITVMKAFGGGELLGSNQIAGVSLTVDQCISYALSRPAVSVVLAGAHTAEQLEKSAAYCEATAEQRDYASALASFPRVSWVGHCMYCTHCEPCPVCLDIASVTKFMHLAEAQKTIPETVREHYASLSRHASECIGCGVCEKRCPFGVKIRDNMKKAVSVFGY